MKTSWVLPLRIPPLVILPVVPLALLTSRSLPLTFLQLLRTDSADVVCSEENKQRVNTTATSVISFRVFPFIITSPVGLLEIQAVLLLFWEDHLLPHDPHPRALKRDTWKRAGHLRSTVERQNIDGGCTGNGVIIQEVDGQAYPKPAVKGPVRIAVLEQLECGGEVPMTTDLFPHPTGHGFSWCAVRLCHGPPLVELHQAEKLLGSSGEDGDAPGTLQSRRYPIIIVISERYASQAATEQHDNPKDTAHAEESAISLF